VSTYIWICRAPPLTTSTDRQALFASLGFGALNFVFAIPAVPAIDTFGRRSLLLSTFPGMAIFLFATGLCFLIDDGQMTLRLGLVATFIYIFTIFYSVGEGPVCFPYAAEVFPNIQREQGMAWAVTVNMFFAAILGLTFPAMKAAMSPLGAFCFYGGLNILATVMIFFLVPETKGLSLEELDDVFSVPTAKFGRYQLTQWLPYMIKRYVLRQNIATPRLHVGHKSVPMAPQPRRLDELEHVDKEQQL
jgi:MFS family permease